MRFKLPKPRARFLALTFILLFASVILPVHASTFVGYTSGMKGSATCPSNCGTPTNANFAFGQTIVSPFAGQLVSVSFQTGQVVPTQVAIATFTTTRPAQTTFNCAVGQTCVIANAGQGFTLQAVVGLTGLSTNTYSTVNLPSPITVSNGQWIAILFYSPSTTLGVLTFCGSDGSPQCQSVGGVSGTAMDTEINFGSTNPTVGNSFNTIITDIGVGALMVGGSFQPIASGSTQITQCYGNCGNPPITLVNTNSTHNINFNQSITLFYEFQSNLNGFLLNVTTSMAKAYNTGTSNTNGPAFGVYAVNSCPLGAPPFSSQCPGLLQAQSQGQNTFQPPKGKISLAGLQMPVFNGQWVGIALTGFFSGLDVNDTNTNVAIFQTNGFIPPVISTSSTFNSASKIGLWAWITGNVVTGGPPTSPPFSTCGPGLDCILTQVVNFSCTVVTQACQTGASIFWIIILTMLSIGILLFFIGETLPGFNLGRTLTVDFTVLIFLGWFAVFASFNLIAPWLVILFMLTISWLFIGKIRGSGPI